MNPDQVGRQVGGQVGDPGDLTAVAAAQGPLIGLDLGTKTIGVAISDGLRLSAHAVVTLRRGRFAENAGELRKLVDERGAGGFVLGLPLNMDGSAGPRAQSTRAFARNLAGAIDLPVALWDERLSTVAAERALLEADTSRRRRADVIDQVAAALILQGALDRLRQMQASETAPK